MTFQKGCVWRSYVAVLMATHFVPRQEALGLLLTVLLGLLCLPSVVVTEPSGTQCPPAPGRSETCVCKSDKGIIDLTSLSKNDGTPRYFVANYLVSEANQIQCIYLGMQIYWSPRSQ